MSAPDQLTLRIYPLDCPECRHVSHKYLLELIQESRLPCDSCRRSINLAREYGKAKLEEILVGLGRRGFIIPDNKELD
jgi:transposase-like protein